MIYITGDCHADWTKFSSNAFPEQKEKMLKWLQKGKEKKNS